MQALILAAGMGSRLGKYTEKNTKCMVQVNGKPLIEYALEALIGEGLSRIVIVVGYQAQSLVDFVGDSYRGIPVLYVTNNIYNKTNNIYSLWLASALFAEDDTILMESDLIFDRQILRRMMEDEAPDLAVVAKYESWMDGTVVCIDGNRRIINFINKGSFRWEARDEYYKTVNMYKLSKNFINNHYLPMLGAYIRTNGSNEYYEQVLRVIAYVSCIEIKALVLDKEKWYELDDIHDKENAELLFSSEEDILGKYQKRYGGYWRFPGLIDFCYLVNPWFPVKGLMDEMKASFDTLIKSYPSGSGMQSLLAAKLFGCEPDEIIVGNGASELIRTVMGRLGGTVGIVSPCFDEYAVQSSGAFVKQLATFQTGFRYDLDTLKSFCQGIDTLVLVNPGNPSGFLLPENQVVQLLEYLSGRGVTLIYDESFIDFADESERYTLLRSRYLQKYKNLIVIKSISKCYGVPGLRLGVLACGNRQTILEAGGGLPIWNINSFAEYFLQIIGKYKAEYAHSCGMVACERTRFRDRLNQSGLLNVYPSGANFFLCELTSGRTSTELARKLLIENNLLIKDLAGKEGLGSGQYVRIAIRSEADNELLADRLLDIAR